MVRLKHRYLICQVLSESSSAVMEEFNIRDLLNILREKIITIWGDFGAIHNSGISIKYFDEVSKIFVLRISRESEMEVHFALSLITTIKRNNIIVRALCVCGSIRTTLKV